MRAGTIIRDSARRLATSWFGLTRDEQTAILVIAAIFLVGLAVRSLQDADTGPKASRVPATGISTRPPK